MKIYLIFASVFLASAATAQHISFSRVTHSGSGCPQGTVSTAISPDGATLSVLFDEFRVEVPQYDSMNDNESAPGRGNPRQRNVPELAYKNCNLSFTVALPEGTKADILEVSYQVRGATIFEPGVEGFFSSVVSGYQGLARSRGASPIVGKRWGGAVVDENWVDNQTSNIILQSGCSSSVGREIKFDIKNQISAEIIGGDLRSRGLIVVDSNDQNGFLKFSVRTRRCTRGGPR